MSERLDRLRQRRDFLRVAAGRRKWVAPGIILQVAANPEVEPGAESGKAPRVGFTASKKVGNAVVRNRARRRLRAAARAVLGPHAMAAHDYVLIARGDTATVPFSALLSGLEAGLRRLKVWQDGSQH